MKILVYGRKKTADGILGLLSIDTPSFGCFTIENLKDAIPAGIYDMVYDYSPRHNRVMPHIRVPSRDLAAGGDAGIRIDIANRPDQLLGCIALGDKKESDSVDDSRVTYMKFQKITQGQAGLQIEIREIEGAA